MQLYTPPAAAVRNGLEVELSSSLSSSSLSSSSSVDTLPPARSRSRFQYSSVSRFISFWDKFLHTQTNIRGYINEIRCFFQQAFRAGRNDNDDTSRSLLEIISAIFAQIYANGLNSLPWSQAGKRSSEPRCHTLPLPAVTESLADLFMVKAGTISWGLITWEMKWSWKRLAAGSSAKI